MLIDAKQSRSWRTGHIHRLSRENEQHLASFLCRCLSVNVSNVPKQSKCCRLQACEISSQYLKILASSSRSRPEIHWQWRFGPKTNQDLIVPWSLIVNLRICKFHVVVPHESSNDQPHLSPSQTESMTVSLGPSNHAHMGIVDSLLSYAIPSSRREGRKCVCLVVGIAGIAEPPLWSERVRISEVGWIVVHGPMPDVHYRLFIESATNLKARYLHSMLHSHFLE